VIALKDRNQKLASIWTSFVETERADNERASQQSGWYCWLSVVGSSWVQPITDLYVPKSGFWAELIGLGEVPLLTHSKWWLGATLYPWQICFDGAVNNEWDLH